jgi:phosphoribosylanthranilate isomerase
VPVKLIKICGITRLEDAEAAVAAGANAVGFVFWPDSPRRVAVDVARRIASTTGVTTVGVFVDQPVEDVNEIADAVGLGVVQLHGTESIGYARKITRPVWKALTLDAPIDAWPADIMILLDAHDPIRKGGTGRTIDWKRAAEVARRRDVVLAGGLKPENVGEAIGKVQPYGIDVSSGVEREPGIKDVERLKALFEAVNGSDNQTRS